MISAESAGSVVSAVDAVTNLASPAVAPGTSTPEIVVDLTGAEPTAVLHVVDAETQLQFPTEQLIDPDAGLLGASRLRLGLKRSVDMAVSAVAIAVLSPLFVLIAVAVALTSRGPVLYKSIRLGQGNEPFVFWKFRTMYDGAHGDRESYSHLNHQSGPIFKIKDDPRRTRIGSILRRSSLDELPQFFHVLGGKMSIVGPRPPLPEEVAQYDEIARQRLLVKPGLTCIWQVSGRASVDFETWIDMDLEYISTWSLRKDAWLMLKTIPAVLRGTGAH